MARVRFEDGTVINFDGTPTPDDIEEAYSSVKGTQQPQTRTQRVEREIAQAPSSIAKFREYLTPTIEQLQARYAPGRAEGMLDMLGEALTPFAAAREAAFGIPSDIVLGRQQGRPAGNLIQELGTIVRRQPTQQPGTIASDIRETLAGRRPAGFGHVALQAGIENPLARAAINNPDVAYGLARAAPSLMGVARAGFGAAGRGLVRTGQFLTGYKQAIQKADTVVTQAAEDLIRSYRRGGANYGSAVSKLSAAQDAAWAPAQQAARSIPTQITRQELEAIATQRLSAPEDAQRLQDVMSTIDRLANTAKKEVFSGEELLSFSSDLGESVPQAVVKGARSLRRPNLVQTDSRAVLLDAIERNAPTGSQGLLSEGFKSYRNYKDVESQWYRVVKPKAGQLAETGGGPAILRKAAGVRSEVPQNLDPETIVQNINKVFGIDLTQPLQKPVSQLRRAEMVGKAGDIVRTLLKYGIPFEVGRRVIFRER